MVSSLIAAGPLAATSVLRIARRRPTIVILAVLLGGLMMRRANRGPDDRHEAQHAVMARAAARLAFARSAAVAVSWSGSA